MDYTIYTNKKDLCLYYYRLSVSQQLLYTEFYNGEGDVHYLLCKLKISKMFDSNTFISS